MGSSSQWFTTSDGCVSFKGGSCNLNIVSCGDSSFTVCSLAFCNKQSWLRLLVKQPLTRQFRVNQFVRNLHTCLSRLHRVSNNTVVSHWFYYFVYAFTEMYIQRYALVNAS